MQRSAQFLQNKKSNDADNALEVIDEALLISSYSEKLLEMKAEAMCLVCSLLHTTANLLFSFSVFP